MSTACVCDDPTICWGAPGVTEGCDACLVLDPERHCLRCECCTPTRDEAQR